MHIPCNSLEAYQSLSRLFYSVVFQSSNKQLLGWESVETQTERFRVFMEEIYTLMPQNAVNNKSFSILDAGCGYAALYAYLQKHNVECQYTGMDYAAQCIEHARLLYSTDATFFQANLFEPTIEVEDWGIYDICFLSGVLNLNIEKMTYKGANYEIMLFVMQKLLRVSKYGVIFNVLHNESPSKDDTFFYHDPKHISNFFESNSIRVLRVRDGYLPNDMTVVLQNEYDTGIVASCNKEGS